MEKEGVVGQANHAGKREILVGEEEPSAIENRAAHYWQVSRSCRHTRAASDTAMRRR